MTLLLAGAQVERALRQRHLCSNSFSTVTLLWLISQKSLCFNNSAEQERLWGYNQCGSNFASVVLLQVPLTWILKFQHSKGMRKRIPQTEACAPRVVSWKPESVFRWNIIGYQLPTEKVYCFNVLLWAWCKDFLQMGRFGRVGAVGILALLPRF